MLSLHVRSTANAHGHAHAIVLQVVSSMMFTSFLMTPLLAICASAQPQITLLTQEYSGDETLKSAHFLPPSCMLPNANPQFCFRDAHKLLIFKHFLRSCHWSNALDSFVPVLVGNIMPDGVYMTGPNAYDNMFDSVPIPQNTYTMQKCIGPDGWAAIRLGPFNTSGGYHWTELTFTITQPAKIFTQRLINGMPSFAFNAYSVGSITSKGDLIGHPPIHQHHYHFFGRGDHPTDVMNIHGEQQCLDEEGGVDCYLKTLPDEYAIVTTKSEFIISMAFNDVRPHGQQLLQSWVLAAVKSVPVGLSIRRVSMMRIELRPLPMISWNSRQTYNISVDVDSVTWDAGNLESFHGYQLEPGGTGAYPGVPQNSTIVEGSIHAHMLLMWDVMFFQGGPDQVFANLNTAARSKHRTEYGAHTIPQTIANIRERMLQPNRAPMACSWRTSSGQERAEISRGVFENFMRVPRCNINPNIRGWVLVALHHNFGDYHSSDFVGAPDHYNSWRKTARMHAYVRIYYAEHAHSMAMQVPGNEE